MGLWSVSIISPLVNKTLDEYLSCVTCTLKNVSHPLLEKYYHEISYPLWNLLFPQNLMPALDSTKPSKVNTPQNIKAYVRFLKRNVISTEAYPEPNQIFKMELFVKIVKGWSPWTIFKKSSVLDVRKYSEDESEVCHI